MTTNKLLPIFICGPHCSGKTSIIKRLEAENLVSFKGHEIGKELYYNRRFITGQQDADFEYEVTQLELQRDHSLTGQSGIAVLESWHPGNLGYVAVRNPAAVADICDVMKKSPLLDKCYGIWLRISKETIISRTKTFSNDRNWAGGFYASVDGNIERCLHLLGVSDRTVIVNAEPELERVYSKVKGVLASIDRYKAL